MHHAARSQLTRSSPDELFCGLRVAQHSFELPAAQLAPRVLVRVPKLYQQLGQVPGARMEVIISKCALAVAAQCRVMQPHRLSNDGATR